MDFLISESQLRILLNEVDDSNLSSSMKKLYLFTKEIISKTIKRYDINVRFFLKFGTAIGGLVYPLDYFIKTGNFQLNDDQTALILIGIAATYFFENSRKVGEIIKKINEEGLLDIFKSCFEKINDLKNAFLNFLSSLKTTIEGTTEMVSYSFLIPIVTDLISMAHQGGDSKETALMIMERLLSSGVVIIIGTSFSELLTKIVERFKN